MANLEKLEHNKVKFTFVITEDSLDKGMEKAYNKDKRNINIPGFRKGKAPRKVIESFYGKDVFFEDGINNCLPGLYTEAIIEHDVKAVSKPDIQVGEMQEDRTITITAEVFVKPDVILGDYKSITYEKSEIVATEEEINKTIEQDREKNARIITVQDRPIKTDDIVTIDFEGLIDGVPFEGGQAADFELKIGSKQFIDTFEEQLIGHNLNEELDVNVTFPEEYHQEDLKGKNTVFKVTIKQISEKILPEIDDDLALDVSEFETLEEYKNHIAQTILNDKLAEADIKRENTIVDKLIESSEVDLPQPMVENQIDNTVNDFANRLRTQGLDLKTYLEYMGQTMEQYREQFKETARKQVLGRIILEQVAITENINVSEEDFDKELDSLADEYKIERERVRDSIREEDKEDFEMDIKVRKALKFILDSAVDIQV